MPTAKKSPEKTVTKPAPGGLSVPVYSLTGTKSPTNLILPKELFGVSVNQPLLSQAMRVYLNNQKSHNSHTKTRAEVDGSTKKIMKQKGSGRARHGGIRAPIFVGGGIALGPKSRTVTLELPKKMRLSALVSALSLRAKEGSVSGLTGLDKSTGKTKDMANLIKKLNLASILLIEKSEMAKRAVRNLPGVDFTTPEMVNPFQVIAHQNLLISKEAVSVLESRVKGSESREVKNVK